ncbi:DUF3717 domain-containing protein [Paraburkholderia mimosarum]|nr:DUF3717 domain-containing protein [Paraburkholderia mimosarum]
MPNILTIAEIEQAINYWCAQESPGTDGALCCWRLCKTDTTRRHKVE